MDEDLLKDKQKKREKLAIVIFLCSILAIIAAVFAYVTFGHNLDLAASSIDSNVGQLDGYLTVVFEGNNTEAPKQVALPNKILNKASDFFNFEFDQSQDSQNNNKEDKSNVNTEPATIANVTEYYKDKSSTMCKIKAYDYGAYKNGEILERGDWSIGLISVPQDVLNSQLASKTPNEQFKKIQETIYRMRFKDEADLIIVTCPSQKVIEYLDKVDCVIATNVDNDIPEEGKQVGSTYIMRNPTKGSIGAITSSPAKMLIGRVYKQVEIPKED